MPTCTADSPSAKGSGNSSLIANASSCYDRDFHCIDNLRHQRHRADLRVDLIVKKRSPMSACFEPLSNDGIATGLLQPFRLFDGGRRRYNLRAGLAHTLEKVLGRKAKVEAHDLRSDLVQEIAMGSLKRRNKNAEETLVGGKGRVRYSMASSTQSRHPPKLDSSQALHGKESLR